MLKQCPECFCWWEDGANFCSIDGASLPESTDPLAKLQYITIKQIVGCMKSLAMQEFGDLYRQVPELARDLLPPPMCVAGPYADLSIVRTIKAVNA